MTTSVQGRLRTGGVFDRRWTLRASLEIGLCVGVVLGIVFVALA
jgi:hypothetical protein